MHKNNFDFFRVFFAIIVLFLHSYTLSGAPENDFFSTWTNGQITASSVILGVFFSISGYFIFQSVLRSSSWEDYMVKRILRIYPAFIVVVIFTALFGFFVSGVSARQYYTDSSVWTYITTNLNVFHRQQYRIGNIFSTNPYKYAIDGSIWTIPYEFLFYIIFSLLFILKKMPKVLTPILVVSYLGLFLLQMIINGSGFIFFLDHAFELHEFVKLGLFFFGGAILAAFNINEFQYKTPLLIISCVLSLLFLAAGIFPFILFLMLPLIIICTGTYATKGIAGLSGKIGDFSYGIYVYGFIIQQTLVHYFRLNYLQLIFTSIPIACIFGALSWHLIEKRALALKRYFPLPKITLKRKQLTLLAIAIILISGITIFATFPSDNMYYRGADEGNYYRQAHLLLENGYGGFKVIANTFINTLSLHDSPHPLRPGAIVLIALFLLFHNSFSALSFLSLISFIGLLIATYLFISRYWNYTLALFVVLLMAFSPLAMDMSRRALTDSAAFAAMSVTIFAFLHFMEKGSYKRMIFFIACFSAAILIKETGVLLFPFFVLVYIFLKNKNEYVPPKEEFLKAVFLPIIICILSYILLYGWTNVVTILGILRQPSAYSAIYGQGPWYRYLVDYLMLSPFTLILAVCAIGYLFLLKGFDKKTAIFAGLAIYLLVVFSFLSKNIRYCLLLDLPIRFFAAYFFWIIYSSIAKRKWLPIAALLLISAVDCSAYYSYFITNNIYDTISLNLLSANHIIPSADNPPKVVNPAVSAIRTKVKLYVDSSILLYKEGAYQKSIDASMQALQVDSNCAVAYNNICSAYNQLHEWDKAIAAGRKALQIDPAFTLARNNLHWAERQMNAKKQ